MKIKQSAMRIHADVKANHPLLSESTWCNKFHLKIALKLFPSPTPTEPEIHMQSARGEVYLNKMNRFWKSFLVVIARTSSAFVRMFPKIKFVSTHADCAQREICINAFELCTCSLCTWHCVHFWWKFRIESTHTYSKRCLGGFVFHKTLAEVLMRNTNLKISINYSTVIECGLKPLSSNQFEELSTRPESVSVTTENSI